MGMNNGGRYRFDADGARMAQNQMGLQAVKGGGFIGSNSYNYSVSSADGSREAEIALHNYKMSVITKPSSKKKELKRHINALAAMSSADGSSVWTTVTDIAKGAIAQPTMSEPVDSGSRTIMGMPLVLFYSILGVIALTIIVLIVTRKK